MAWIYVDGGWFGPTYGVKLSVSNQPGVVEIKEKNGNVIGVAALTATSSVVIADNVPPR